MPVTAPAVSWLQAPFRAPTGATVRLTIFSSGGNHDWAYVEGESWASLDDLAADWTEALAGAAIVEVAADSEKHQGRIRVTTYNAANYTITWSHAGSGTALRDRLGRVADVGSTGSGSDWSTTVKGAFYSWVGFGGLARSRTAVHGGAAGRTMAGIIVSQHSGDGGRDIVEADLMLRWGIPPGGVRSFLGHAAFESFLVDLYGEPNTPSDTFALYQSAPSLERWLVRLGRDRMTLRPSAPQGSSPFALFELRLAVDVIEAGA